MTTKIVNVVATGWLGSMLDLHSLAQRLPNIEYNPRRFSAAIHRQRGPNTTLLVFGSGRFVCTGAKCVADARKSARRFARRVQKLLSQSPIRFLQFQVQNVVGALKCEHKIAMEEFYAHRQRQCQWKQELFPAGLRYQPHLLDKRLCVLVFPSGRCVLTGAHTELEIIELGDEMRRLFLRYRK